MRGIGAALALVLALGGCGRPARHAVQPSPEPMGHGSSGLWQAVAEPVSQLRADTKAAMARGVDQARFVRGDRHKRQICLTIDDGPHPGPTERLLAILRAEQVKATFFVVGKMAQRYPHLVRAEAADGHEIGSHTFHHVNMTRVPEAELRRELTETNDVLTDILGHGAELLRPPGGQYNARTVEVARLVGLTTVLWTDDPGDYDQRIAPELILRRTIRDASPGGIILLHDGPQSTLAILPRLIHYLRAQGYTFVTCGELMRDARAKPPAQTR